MSLLYFSLTAFSGRSSLSSTACRKCRLVLHVNLNHYRFKIGLQGAFFDTFILSHFCPRSYFSLSTRQYISFYSYFAPYNMIKKKWKIANKENKYQVEERYDRKSSLKKEKIIAFLLLLFVNTLWGFNLC